MAENDIYNNQGTYERFKANLNELAEKPTGNEKDGRKANRKYYSRNPENLQHFRTLFRLLEAKDLSFVRSLRLSQTLKLIVNSTDKNLANCNRDDIDAIVTAMHKAYESPKSKHDFMRDIKLLWKLLFPERDEKGRIDDAVFPYVVRHLSAKVDRSRQKKRNDKLTWEEYEKLLAYFEKDKRIQAYIALAVESLARPQELLYLRIRDVEAHESYARISLSEHGKEGTGTLQCIDSYPYLLKWLEQHHLRKDNNAILFPSEYHGRFGKQLCPEGITQKLQTACRNIGIDKNVTAYSLKRNGVTFRRLKGDSDVQIMHAARWRSTRQLQTYDLSEQEDAFKIELAKRGLIKDETLRHYQPAFRTCAFCSERSPFNSDFCSKCKRSFNATIQKNSSELKTQVETLVADIIAKMLKPNVQAELAKPDIQEQARKLLENA